MSASAIDRRLEKGDWERMCQGVYRLVAFPRTLEQQLMGGCLWGGDGACASHRAAATLLRLDGAGPDVAEITVEGKRRSPFSGLIVHRRSDWLDCDRSHVGVIPTTDVTRTLIDLGSVVSVEGLELALDAALRRRMTSVRRVSWRIEQSGAVGRKGAARLAKLLEVRAESRSLESALEVKFARVLRRSDLPPPVPQHEVLVDGRPIARIDFAYPDARLAIEIDGYEFHQGRARWQHDLTRRSRLATLGWRVLHFTASDLREPAAVVAAISAALQPRLPL